MTTKTDLLSKHAELLQKADELKTQIDSMKDEPAKRTGRIRSADELKKGDDYYVLGHDGIYQWIFDSYPSDLGRIRNGITYYDGESAQRAYDLRELMTRMDNAAAESGEVDWGDYGVLKYRIALDVHERELEVISNFTYKSAAAPYFATREAAQAFLDSLSYYERELLSGGV